MGKTWTMISVLAGMISAICAALVVYQTSTAWKHQYESQRPYLTLEKPGIEKTEGEHPFEIRITVNNIGVRPANKFKGKVFVFERPFEKGPYFTSLFSSVNDIPPGVSPTWREGIKGFQSADVPIQYYVVSIKYSDAIDNETFHQIFYLNWKGLKEGKGPAGFSHASPSNAVELDKVLGNSILDF